MISCLLEPYISMLLTALKPLILSKMKAVFGYQVIYYAK